MNLDPWQKEFLETKGDKLLCTGRQVGKSVVASLDAARWAVNNSGKTVLMIAPTERQAYALFDKTLNAILAIDKKVVCSGKDRPTKQRIKLKNHTVIWCLPTGLSGLGIRFLTVHRLYADEASRIPEAVWDAVTPMMLTTGGDTILLSTPFGTQGFFYEVLINKNNAFPNFTHFRKDSRDVVSEREICDSWSEHQREKALQRLDAERARMSTLAYAQEYMGQPLNDLMQVFPDTLLQEVMILAPRDRVWEGRDYFLGQDIAGMGEDDSTWIVLDGTKRELVQQTECIVKKKLRTPERVQLTLDLEAKYGFKQIGIDDGGLGSGDFDYLLNSPVKRRVVSLNNARRDLDRDGTRKKKLLKEEMYNNLLAMMESKHIQLLRDNAIYESLRSIQFEVTDKGVSYFGDDSHIAEGLIRAAWLTRNKSLNIYIY